MREDTDQNNSEYGLFSRNVTCHVSYFTITFFAGTKSRTANNHVPVIKFIKTLASNNISSYFLRILSLQPQKRFH